MITKDEVTAIAIEHGIAIHGVNVAAIAEPPTWEAMQRFASACYRQGVEDALSEIHKHDDEFITERAIRALLDETECYPNRIG